MTVLSPLSLGSSGRLEASTSATMSFYRILSGFGANFGPFFKSECFAGCSGFLERLTELSLSTSSVGKLWEFFKLLNFLSCLALMLHCNAWALLCKNCIKEEKGTPSSNEESSRWMLSMILFDELIRSRRMEILARIQPNKWPAPNVSGFIAQLARTGIARSGFQTRWSPEFFMFLYAIAKIAFIMTARIIDPMLPLNYSFVHIQNSPTNLVRSMLLMFQVRSKFFRIFVSKTRLVGLFWIWTKE